MFCSHLCGQNIISNADFSQISGTQNCTTWRGGLGGGAYQAAYSSDWYSALDSLPEIINTGWHIHKCQSIWQITNSNGAKPGHYPFPRELTGEGYGQISLFKSSLNPTMSRGFISQILPDTLEVSQEYCIEFYTRPFVWSNAVTNNIGVYFTADSLDYYAYNQNITPHLEASKVISDTTTWTRVKGSFVANGTERFFNLGNFRSDAASTMIPSGFNIIPWYTYNIPSYLIDAVSVCKCADTVYTVSLPADTTLCIGEQLTLQPQLNGFLLEDSVTTYLWSTGSTDSSIVVTQPGTYWVQSNINHRFKAADTIVVDFYKQYSLNLPDTVSFCENEFATLYATPMPQAFYFWSNGDTTASTQVYYPDLYFVNVSTPCYTLQDSSIVIQKLCNQNVYIPSAFTPNNDGANDYFIFTGIDNPTFTVYNRWGQMVFKADDYQQNWSGTNQYGQALPAGAYTYTIEYLYVNPNSSNPQPIGSKRFLKGMVSIIRTE